MYVFYAVFLGQQARNLNPIPYSAEYYGHKVHLDQNEKIAMFRATHVIAVDGFSSRIVGHSTMPVKNNLTIYNDVYRYSAFMFAKFSFGEKSYFSASIPLWFMVMFEKKLYTQVCKSIVLGIQFNF